MQQVANGKLSLRELGSLVKKAYADWSEDGGPRLGAALSYYTVFSLAPLLTLMISIAGILFGEEAVTGRVFQELKNIVGPEASAFIQDVVAASAKKEQGIVASLIGLAVLIFAATGFFAQLQDALNIVWEVRRVKALGIIGALRRYWWSFTMILGCGFLLLVSLVLSAVLSALTNYASERFALHQILIEALHFTLSIGIITLLFALIFKYVPNVRVRWRDVWFGALFTSILFVVGKTLLAIYLGRVGVMSTYGAAGALVLILLWSYYSAQLLLFGAECTQVMASRKGQAIVPAEGYAPADECELKATAGTTSRGDRELKLQPAL